MTLTRQIIVTVVALLAAVVVAGAAMVVMLDGAPISVEGGVPYAAVTVPMIGVVVFWLVARALGALLEPIRTFIFGALVVYGTLYFVGRIITFTAMTDGLVLALALLVIIGCAFGSVRGATRAAGLRE
ncbi:hypothetical protein AB3Y40_11460 [Yoonia sp. R2331]|uniref:hypothetical protein n=1 Tax=Yoonia sp. R2331 TaxID=3237238 RepID=UPI0034E3F67F